jgi:hypothetical protein
MISRPGAVLLLAIALPAGSAQAAMPAVKSSSTNDVPACTTPGRLIEYLKWRNPSLAARFREVPVAYMRHGEELGVRWDYAFFQMIAETGGLSFKRGNGKPGDVTPSQNNFAGLGATGNGVSGDSFPDVATGVKAHLQHVLLYAGDTIADPVADRTRKVQEWGVLTAWRKGFKDPITYTDLARKWAEGSKGYADTVEAVGKRFYDDFCNKPDPEPQLVAEARKGRSQLAAEAEQPRVEPFDRISGAELARQAFERARREGDAARSSLGFNVASTVTAQPTADRGQRSGPTIAARSGQLMPAASTSGTDTPATVASQPAAAAVVQTASAAAVARPAAAPKAPPAPKCRVWTASYGGLKSVIIRSVSDHQTNYTVLDVNEGAEAREVDAYVAAYAKGGQKMGDFSSQSQALDKAFQLCPEG